MSDTNTPVGMKKYKCHKVVEGMEIDRISPFRDKPGQYSILGKDENDTVISFDTEEKWMDRHKPEVGGYIVRYEDGYVSYSPTQAFEEGYSLIVGSASNEVGVPVPLEVNLP